MSMMLPLSGPRFASTRVRRPSAQHSTPDDRLTQRERALERQAADIAEREAALTAREQRIKKQLRAIEAHEDEPIESSPTAGDVAPRLQNHQRELGGTPPSRQASATARMIIAADEQRRGLVAADDVPLPKDPAARMIAAAARGKISTTQAQPQPNATARMIINADKMRNGADIDELT